MTHRKCMVIHKEAHREMFAVPYLKTTTIFMECIICHHTWEKIRNDDS